MWNSYKKEGLTVWTLAPQYKLHEYGPHLLEEVNHPDADRANRWELSGNGFVYEQLMDKGLSTLPKGSYRYQAVDHREVLVEAPLGQTEEILSLDNNINILSDYKQFRDAQNAYKELKFKHRRGVLLYGPPGTGKTSIIGKIARAVLNEGDGLVIYLDTDLALNYTRALKQDPRPKLFVFEEFTNCLKYGEVSGELLDFLDGEDSIESSFIIASTNYPERLPHNVTARPGRFDKLYKIGYLSESDINKYMTHFGVEPTDRLLNQEHMTVAILKEIILLIKRDGLGVNTALDKLLQHIELSKKDFSEQRAIGF